MSQCQLNVADLRFLYDELTWRSLEAELLFAIEIIIFEVSPKKVQLGKM